MDGWMDGFDKMDEQDLMKEQEFWDLAALSALRMQGAAVPANLQAKFAADAADALTVRRQARLAEQNRDTDPVELSPEDPRRTRPTVQMPSVVGRRTHVYGDTSRVPVPPSKIDWDHEEGNRG